MVKFILMYYIFLYLILPFSTPRQDLKAFSGDSFDVKDWINATFKTQPEAQTNKEASKKYE